MDVTIVGIVLGEGETTPSCRGEIDGLGNPINGYNHQVSN